MVNYYCHRCAVSNGIVSPEIPDDLSGTTYKLEKYLKHTDPVQSGNYPINSLFNDPSYDSYKNYIVNTMSSGAVMVDDRGRINMFWYAGKNIGVTYHNGQFVTSGDTVKVVLHNDEYKIHAYPTKITISGTATCEICGAIIPP